MVTWTHGLKTLQQTRREGVERGDPGRTYPASNSEVEVRMGRN